MTRAFSISSPSVLYGPQFIDSKFPSKEKRLRSFSSISYVIDVSRTLNSILLTVTKPYWKNRFLTPFSVFPFSEVCA